MKHTILENLRYFYPYVAEDAAKYHQVNMYEVIVDLIDGSSILYDDLEKSIRVLPNNSDDMSEEECRKEFGYRLRRIMYIKRVNQAELSARTGISQTMLSHYMNGKASPSFYNVDRICRALECSIDELRYLR